MQELEEMPLKYKIEREGAELVVIMDLDDGGEPVVCRGAIRDRLLSFCENLTADYEKAAEQLDLEQRNDV